MAQETKVGLLIGLALILLVGLVLSDLFTAADPDTVAPGPAATDFGGQAQAGIYDQTAAANPRPAIRPQTEAGFESFATEPALDYLPQPEPITAPETPDTPGTPGRYPDTPLLPAPGELTVEPPLPNFDALDARSPVARFNESFEAMRLAVQESPPALPEKIEPLILPTPPSTDEASTGGTTYIHYVQAGQTLSEIARQHYGNPEFAAAIAQTNPTKIDREGQVRPGVRLEIPPLGSPVFSRLFQPVHQEHAVRIDATPIPALPDRPTGPTAVTPAASASTNTIEVQPGDTLSELAAEHLGSSRQWRAIVEANADQLASAADLRSGMTLRLPTPTNTPVTTPQTVAPDATTTAAPSTPDNVYVVQAGDNLTRIAERLLGDGDRWNDLLSANTDQLDRPENLQVGMKLKVPTPGSSAAAPVASTPRAAPAPATPSQATTDKTYTVQAGDNLTRIAAAQLGDGGRWRELYEANTDQLSSPNDLFAGQTLRLP